MARLLLAALVAAGSLARADAPGPAVGPRTPAAPQAPAARPDPTVAPGLPVAVSVATHHDTSRPGPAMAAPLERAALEAALDEVAEAQRAKRVRRAEEHGTGVGSKQRDPVPMGTDVAAGRDTARQRGRPVGAVATAPAWEGLGTRFAGWAGSGTRYTPPDTDGDVGRDHYVQVVSATMVVLDKTSGAVVFGPISTSALWQGFGGPCELDHADAVVRYDQLADRWLLGRPTVGSKTGPYLYCLAVSATGDPAGAWHRYAFPYELIPDFAKLSVWPDAYYATYNMYDATETFQGARICALERAALLDGREPRQICASPLWGYSSLLAADLDGATPPPAGLPVPVVALGLRTDTLATWSFAVDWTPGGRSTFSLASELPIPAFAYPCGSGGACVPQPETATRLDTMGDRLMPRLAYRNRGGTGSLVVAHTVGLSDGSGLAGQAAVRWYQLDVTAATGPVPAGSSALAIRLRQAGTFAPDGRHRFLPSIAADGSGAIALGYTLADAATYPSIALTGRLADDTAGTMSRAETVAVPGGGSQTTLSGLGITRWGDYASLAVDPVDDCTFYFASEVLPESGVFNWATGIARFRFPSCLPADGSALPDATVLGADAGGATGGQAGSGGIGGSGTSGGAGSPSSPVGGVAGVTCTAPCPEGGTLIAGRITAVAPSRGGPGTVVTITGRDLAGASAVWFNGLRSPRIAVLSPTRLIAAVPRGATGVGRVTVTVPGGTAAAPARFTVTRFASPPAIASITPRSGPPGTAITVRGRNLLGATSVRVGGVAARSVRALGPDALVVVVPAGAQSGPVTVTTPGGRASSLARFRVR